MIAHLAGPVAEATGKYIDWGVIQISVTNLLIIVGMIVLFVLALVLPFPGAKAEPTDRERSDDAA